MRGKSFTVILFAYTLFCLAISFVLLVYVLAGSREESLISSEVTLDASIDDSRTVLKETPLPVDSDSLSGNPLYFVGDVMLARNIETIMIKEGSDYPFRNLSFLATNTAAVVGNFEASIPKVHFKTPDLTFSFAVDKAHLPDLKQAGFTHLSLANNHALDYGEKGLASTQAELLKAGFLTLGNPKSEAASTSLKFLTLGEKIIAVLALNTIDRIPSLEEIQTLMLEANKTSDLQIAYIHWGNEYSSVHSTAQHNLAWELSKLGIDLIFGHHPHVVQDIETVGNTVVFYSLGNFIFDQYFSPDVQTGLVLKLGVGTSGYEIELLPVTSLETRAQPRLLSAEEKEAFLKKLADKSEEKLQVMIADGRLNLSKALATSTEMTMME